MGVAIAHSWTKTRSYDFFQGPVSAESTWLSSLFHYYRSNMDTLLHTWTQRIIQTIQMAKVDLSARKVMGYIWSCDCQNYSSSCYKRLRVLQVLHHFLDKGKPELQENHRRLAHRNIFFPFINATAPFFANMVALFGMVQSIEAPSLNEVNTFKSWLRRKIKTSYPER